MVPAFILLSAVILQTISAQCLGPYGPGMGLPGLGGLDMAYGPGYPGPGMGAAGVTTSGGGFMVTSSSPLSPTGITVQTDNMAIEGPLLVSGQLPFLGVVALEGPLPVAGAGAVSYGCGTGGVGIMNEVGGHMGPAYPGAYGPEFGPYGYNGFPNAYGPGCGYY